MECVICGKQKGVFSVIDLEGKICQECNDRLNSFSYGNQAQAKAYFDLMSNREGIDNGVKRFLELKEREYSHYIDEEEVRRAKKALTLENRQGETNNLASHPENTKEVYDNPYLIQNGVEHNSTSQCTADKEFYHTISNIESKLDEQNSSLRTIKNILIFFAILAVIGLTGMLIYAIQFVNIIKELY